MPGARHYPGYFEDFVEHAFNARSVRPDTTNTEINPFEYFPYDVVNLDYTGAGFKHRGEKSSREMNAVQRLFQIQSFNKIEVVQIVV